MAPKMQPDFETLRNALDFDVSRETFEKLEIYHALLLKWQKAINLVSPKTLDDSWNRHFIDSMQILNFVADDAKIIADIGSGGGFPGMLIAISRPDIFVNLIESDERKCHFLRTVSRETSSPVQAYDVRIEKSYDVCVPDIVTARALANLSDLLGLVLPWVEKNPKLECLFMKGQNAENEIQDAQECYEFDCECYDSVTDSDAKILKISNIKKR
jgi:16S rRNA (guanine527-N7)-methyltransferase